MAFLKKAYPDVEKVMEMAKKRLTMPELGNISTSRY